MATMPVSPTDFERDFSSLLEKIQAAIGNVIPFTTEQPAPKPPKPSTAKDSAYPLTF